MRTFILGSSTSLLAIALLQPTPALAQSDSAATASDTSGDIVVTANRREESAQKVSISMTVFDAAALSTMQTINDLSKVVPNVQLEQTSGMSFQRVGIRGIAQSDFNANATTSNMVYLDDVPMNAPIAQGVAMWDLERAEVLRGPQGTLFGRNATGGAIRYIARMPGDQWGGEGSVTLGRFNKQEARAAIGGPIASGIGLRLSYVGTKSDGSYYNAITRQRDGREHYYGVRGVLVLEPSDTITAVLRAQYFKGGSDPIMVKSTPGLASQEGFLPAAQLAALQASYGATGIAPASDFSQIENDMPGREEVEHLPLSLTIDVDLGGATLTSNTGYLYVKQRFQLDVDGSPAPILNEYDKHKDRQWTQEIRLTSAGSGPLQWIVGGFYMHEKIDADLNFQASEWLRNSGFDAFDTVLYRRGSQTTTESYAGFVNATYQFTDQLKLTAGLRYTHEAKEITYRFRSRWNFPSTAAGTIFEALDFIKAVDSGNLGTLITAEQAPLIFDDSWNNLSFKAALDYQINPSTLVYGLISRGFKGGSFQPNANLQSQVLDANGDPISVKPETVTDYEIGIKADIVPRALRVNASAYYYDYRNYQTNQFIAAIVGQQLSSLPKARVIGAELEVRAEPVDNLVLNFGMGITDSKIVNSLDPSLVGNDLPLAEKFNANGAVSYALETPIGKITPEVGFKYRGRYYTNKENDTPLGKYAIYNARIAYESPGGGIFGSLWANNFTNVRRPIAVDDSFEYFGGNFAYISPRATYGITIGARY